MARGKVLNAGMLDNYITVSRPTTEETEKGDLRIISNIPVVELWGMIEERPSSTDINVGRKRLSRTIQVVVRTRDAEGIDIDDELSFGQISGSWQVNNIWESDWRYGTTLIAERKD